MGLILSNRYFRVKRYDRFKMLEHHMSSTDPFVLALQRLCDKVGGHDALAARIGANGQSIYQIVSERKLPSGNPKGVGPNLRAKISQAFPDWLDVDRATTARPNVSPAPIGARKVPVISAIQAGMWSEIVDHFEPGEADDWLLTDLELSANSFALTIRGDSMLPEFNPGDRVIIDPAVSPHPGDFVAAKNGDQEATFKKYRPRGMDAAGNMVFELVPLNEDYPTLRSDIQPIRIVGTMVEHRKYRRPR